MKKYKEIVVAITIQVIFQNCQFNIFLTYFLSSIMLSIDSSNDRSSASIVFDIVPRFLSDEYEENVVEYPDTFLQIDEVRISPCQIVFDNAFEGKSYRKKITIQNVGKASAFVRICPASSSVNFHSLTARHNNLY